MNSNYTRKLCTVILTLFLVQLAQAQTTGLVLDHDSSEPLIGAVIKSGKYYTVTNVDGTFQLKAAVGDSIEISYVGYQTYKAIIQKEYLKIVLRQKQERLNEVSVVSLSADEAEAKRIKSSVTPVTVITSKELVSRAGNLNEILARQAGIQIRQTGGLGTAARINIRGLEGKRVQIFINGNPLNTPDGSLGINDLPLQVIERVEVYKGAVPAWLGGDGLGSAVNVVIKHRDVSYIDANLERQSYNTSRAGLIVKKSFDKPGISLGVGVFNTFSDNNYTMDVPFQENLNVVRDHDKFHSLLIGGGFRFHKLWFDEIEIEGAYLKTHKELQGITQNIQHAESRGKTAVGVLKLKKKGLLNNRLSFRYTLIKGEVDVNFIDTSAYVYNWEGVATPSHLRRGEQGNGPNYSNTKQKELRQRLNVNYKLSERSSLNLNNTFRKGDFFPTDDLGNEYAGKNIYNYPGALLNLVSGLTFERENKAKNFLFSAAAKHYYNQTDGYNTNVYIEKAPDEVNTSRHNWGYNIGLRYNFNEFLLAKAVHERAITLPNNAELFGDGVLITPSIKLQPEEAYNYNVGLVYDRIISGNRRIQADVNGFYMNVDNLIQLSGNGLSIGYVNYAKAYIAGADFEVKTDLTPWLYSGLNVTYQKVVDNNEFTPGTQEVPNPTYGLDIPNIPQFFTNLNLEFHKSNLFFKNSKTRLLYDLSYTQEYNFGFELSIYDDLIIPSFLTHTISVEQAFQNDRYTCTFEVNNLTNQMVINNYNQPLPGRTFRVKLRCLLLGKRTHNHNHHNH